jgi:hypothetical protein
MRLDSYADLVVDERDESGQLQEDVALGAAGLHELIVAGVNGGDASLGVGAMPPRFSLDDNQIETLERWSATADASGRPARGEPRDGNRVPVIAILETSQAGALVVLRTDVSDADGDLVAGELRVRVGAVDRFVGGLRSGLFEVRWDTAEIQPTIPPGTYPLFARLDDGADVSEISLGMLSIGGP